MDGVGLQLETKLCSMVLQPHAFLCIYSPFWGLKKSTFSQWLNDSPDIAPFGTKLQCDCRQVTAGEVWLAPLFFFICGVTRREHVHGKCRHMFDLLLETAGARRGRCLLPRLAQLHALFIAIGQKLFYSGQNCQPERQQDVSRHWDKPYGI